MENKIKDMGEMIEHGPWYIIMWENNGASMIEKYEHGASVIEKYEYFEEVNKRIEELNKQYCGFYERVNRYEIKKQFGIWLAI